MLSYFIVLPFMLYLMAATYWEESAIYPLLHTHTHHDWLVSLWLMGKNNTVLLERTSGFKLMIFQYYEEWLSQPFPNFQTNRNYFSWCYKTPYTLLQIVQHKLKSHDRCPTSPFFSETEWSLRASNPCLANSDAGGQIPLHQIDRVIHQVWEEP